MVELSYFQFASFLLLFLIMGIGFAWRIERTRYERLIDIFRIENEKLKTALHEEMTKNEKLNQQNHNEKTKNDLLKKRLNSLYGEK